MSDMTRRRFIESAGLAAAVPALAGGVPEPVAAQAPATPSRATKRARDLSDAELEAMFHRCSNTGRWGPDD
jgi:hypothetical protein